MIRIVTRACGLLSPRYRRIPRPIFDRGDQRAAWREFFTEEEMVRVDTLLRSLCESFCFHEDDRYLFAPNDTIADVYRACYPRWRFWVIGDVMELESLLLRLEQDYRLDVSSLHSGCSLKELVAMACM